METRPFTLEQAKQVAADFNHLLGKQLSSALHNVVIEHILISPFDDENRHRFIDNFYNGYDQDEALSGYPGPFYDVLIVGDYHDVTRQIHRGIRSYCEEYQIKYDFPSFPS